jgi:hypothetical protein
VAGEHVGKVRRPCQGPHLLRHPRHQHREPEGRPRVLQGLLANFLTKPHAHLRSVATYRLLQGISLNLCFCVNLTSELDHWSSIFFFNRPPEVLKWSVLGPEMSK